MKVFHTNVLAIVSGGLLGAAAAFAMAPVDYGNPGYQWGRTHCGPAPSTGGKTSEQQCKNCCGAGERDDVTFPTGEGAGCEAFCERAMWPS